MNIDYKPFYWGRTLMLSRSLSTGEETTYLQAAVFGQLKADARPNETAAWSELQCDAFKLLGWEVQAFSHQAESGPETDDRLSARMSTAIDNWLTPAMATQALKLLKHWCGVERSVTPDAVPPRTLTLVIANSRKDIWVLDVTASANTHCSLALETLPVKTTTSASMRRYHPEPGFWKLGPTLERAVAGHLGEGIVSAQLLLQDQ